MKVHATFPPLSMLENDDQLSAYFRDHVPLLEPQLIVSKRQAMMINWTAKEYIEQRRNGGVTCEEYVSVLVERMLFYRECAVFMVSSYERARQIVDSAVEMDRKAEMFGIESISPLYGLPVPVKGTMATVDFESSAGSSVLDRCMGVKDADVVDLLKKANGIVMGKTNVPEFASSWITINPVNGRTLNPYDSKLTSGGSSGGAGAAVSFFIAPISLTEDTSGSTRHPAFQNQNFGYDPTRNHYPNKGNPGISFFNDQVGLNTRSFEDILLFDAALLGTHEEHEQAKLNSMKLSNEEISVGCPLFPWVEFELPEDAFNFYKLRNFAVSDELREKYEATKLVLSNANYVCLDEEFPITQSNIFGRDVNSILHILWGKHVVNGKVFETIGSVGFHTWTGAIAEWVHEYLDVPVSNKEIFESCKRIGRAHDPVKFFSVSKMTDESQYRFNSLMQIEKVKIWNSYFDMYGVDVIMTPCQFYNAVEYEQMANATVPLKTLQQDGSYKLEPSSISEGNTVSYMAFKDIPIPKIVVPTGLDREGRPTAIEFWGRSVPLDHLYNDEFAKYHDLEFLYIVKRLVETVESDPFLTRVDSPLTPSTSWFPNL